MATKVNINGKLYARPDVYSTIISGVNNPIQNLSYGNVVIIDDGIGTGWGGGSAVAGELKQGAGSVYKFTQISDFRNFIKGGPLWELVEPLFQPDGPGTTGVSNLFYLKAATTTAAKLTLTFTNGTFKIQSKDEGTWANGALTSTNLSKGYALKLVAGATSGTFIVEFYKGTFVGTNPETGLPYNNEKDASLAIPLLLFKSPEFVAISDLHSWATSSADFNGLFNFDPTSTATGAAVAGDITSNVGFKLLAGGTETYSTDDFDACLESIKNLDNSFFFSTKVGVEAAGVNNTKILSWIGDGNFKYPKYLVVAGGRTSAKFKTGSDSSVEIAKYFDSSKVIVIHGGALKSDRMQLSGFRKVSQLYKAAAVLGRACGLEPQVPLTFKTIGIDGEEHTLTDSEKEVAIENGVLYTNFDYELNDFIIGSGINTLQDNQFLVNNDGDSYAISVERIKSQLCKEVIFTSKRKFFSTNVGPNRGTVTPEDITSWLGGFLTSKTATDLQDNLIITWRNIQVIVDQDIYYVTFEFVPNFPVEKIVFSGKLMLN